MLMRIYCRLSCVEVTVWVVIEYVWEQCGCCPLGWAVGGAGFLHSRAVLCGHRWLCLGMLVSEPGDRGWFCFNFGWNHASSKCSAVSSCCACCPAFSPLPWSFFSWLVPNNERSPRWNHGLMCMIQFQHSSVDLHYFSYKITMVSHSLGSDFFTLYQECSALRRPGGGLCSST